MQKCPVMILALLILAAPAGAQRLSDNVAPEHYTLWFAPDLATATFRGRESIRVQVRASTQAITLHAAEIEFDEVTIEADGVSQTARVTLDARTETATFTVPRNIPAGRATIHVRYRGMLNDKLRGFYLSRANGRRYAVTQLEATDARRAFPSFDEPTYKATFELSMMIDNADAAISNGAQVSDTPGPEPGKHTLSFATTSKMSSYLVAMVVGDFVCRSGASDGTPIRVCSTPDKLGLTAYALEAAEQQLAFFNDYFGIEYPFGKLDIIAVPDFAAGAMENVGAIIFRERSLLVDPARASFNAQKGVASIISHEIAHQWFGNLVTMKWWNDIWLNEGFATWIASRPLAAWRPDWNVQLDDATDTQSALGLDALRSTRAIRIDVDTPDEINEVFDGIAYEKTAGVLRMLEAYVGPEAFRKGISSYLQTYAFSNAAGEDFWGEMTRVTGRPVDRIMRAFVEQTGAPVVSVQTRCTGAGMDHDAGTREIRRCTGRCPVGRALLDHAGVLQASQRPGELRVARPTPADNPGACMRCDLLCQRRQPWLLLHRVHARRSEGAGARRGRSGSDRTAEPAGRRMVDGEGRPPRHRRVPRPCRRPRERQDRRRHRHARDASRLHWRIPRHTRPAATLAALDSGAFRPAARGSRRAWRPA